MPMDLWASSCIKVSTEEIMFLGSAVGEFYYYHSILNMTDKTWSLHGPNKYQGPTLQNIFVTTSCSENWSNLA